MQRSNEHQSKQDNERKINVKKKEGRYDNRIVMWKR